MLGSATFDIVIGMVFLFLLLSLVASAIREAIEARLKTRSKLLAHGIVQMLGDGNAKRLYEHPLIKALYVGGKFDERAAGFKGHVLFSWLFMLPASLFHQTRMPGYIPARTFALALMNLAATKELVGPGVAAGAAVPFVNPPLTRTLLVEVRNALAGRTDDAARGLLAALSVADADTSKALDGVQKWYDGAMDRVSGRYKRETQHILFWLGLVIAVGMNVDSIFLTQYLAANEDARKSMAAAAEGAAKDPALIKLVDAQRKKADTTAAAAAVPAASEASTPSVEDQRKAIEQADAGVSDAIRRVNDQNLPIGWTTARWAGFTDWRNQSLRNLSTIAGWLLTAFAVSFGAPFWFDLLNKLMVIRSTVKPHEKSQEESSEDRQK